MTETTSGAEHRMADQPRDEMAGYTGSGLLGGRTALVTGGDSGIGRAVAVAFAKEGADVAIVYFQQDEDAERTVELVEAAGRRCLAIRCDIAHPEDRRDLVAQVVAEFGAIDVLVNNAGVQEPMTVESLTLDHWRRTFAVNLEPVFFLTKEVLPHMPDGGAIINTASITGLRGHKELLDYSTTKGAIITLTMTLAQALVERRIRVNAIAPGPVWTPLIPATFPPEKVESFGKDTPFGRPAQPDEIAPSYVFFASDRLSSYYSGEVLSPVGGPGQLTR